jgi:hypothetical protein
MKLALTFGLLTLLFAIAYGVAWAAFFGTLLGTFGLVSPPLWASTVLMISSWGAGISLILFIVFLILKR